jgi:hypothetical protein
MKVVSQKVQYWEGNGADSYHLCRNFRTYLAEDKIHAHCKTNWLLWNALYAVQKLHKAHKRTVGTKWNVLNIKAGGAYWSKKSHWLKQNFPFTIQHTHIYINYFICKYALLKIMGLFLYILIGNNFFNCPFESLSKYTVMIRRLNLRIGLLMKRYVEMTHASS